MKKYKEKSVQVLMHINQEIGIDFTRYQNHELKNKIFELITIEKYSISAFIKPLIIGFVFYILGFFLLELGKISIFVYGIFGFMFTLFNSIIYGILRLVNNLKKDLRFVLSGSLELTKNICQDFNHLCHNVQNIQHPGCLVLEGILAAIVTPTLASKFSKVPIAGGILMNGSDRVMMFFVKELKTQEEKSGITKFVGSGANKISELISKIEVFITSFAEKIDTILKNSFTSIQFPIRILFVISLFFTFIFIALFFMF